MVCGAEALAQRIPVIIGGLDLVFASSLEAAIAVACNNHNDQSSCNAIAYLAAPARESSGMRVPPHLSGTLSVSSP